MKPVDTREELCRFQEWYEGDGVCPIVGRDFSAQCYKITLSIECQFGLGVIISPVIVGKESFTALRLPANRSFQFSRGMRDDNIFRLRPVARTIITTDIAGYHPQGLLAEAHGAGDVLL